VSEPPEHRFLETLAAIEERRASPGGNAREGDALEQALVAYADASLRAGDRRAVAAAKNRLGLLLARSERRDEAVAALSEALAMRRSLGSAEARSVLESAYNLATCRPLDTSSGDEVLADAASLLDEVVRGTREATDAPGRELSESAHHNLGVVRDERGELAEARRLYERALSLRAKRLGDDHVSLRPTLSRLARLEHRAGRLVFALGYYERALAIARRELSEDDPIVRGLERWRDALTSGEGEA
jgi:tetratricopeptide (TPR) repeat protein